MCDPQNEAAIERVIDEELRAQGQMPPAFKFRQVPAAMTCVEDVQLTERAEGNLYHFEDGSSQFRVVVASCYVGGGRTDLGKRRVIGQCLQHMDEASIVLRAVLHDLEEQIEAARETPRQSG